MSNWPWWVLLPSLILIIGTGGFALAFVIMVILDLAGQSPDARRRKRGS